MQRFIPIMIGLWVCLYGALVHAQSHQFLRKRSDRLRTDKRAVLSVVQLNGKYWTVRGVPDGTVVLPGRQAVNATLLSAGNKTLLLGEGERVVGPIGTDLLTTYGKDETRVIRLNHIGEVRKVSRTLPLPDADLSVESIPGNSDFFYVTDAFEGAGSEITLFDKSLRQAKVIRPFEGAYRTVTMVAAGNQLVAICEAGYGTHPITLLYFDAKTLAETGQIELPPPYTYNPSVTVLGTDLYIQTNSYQSGQTVFKPFLVAANREIKELPTGLLLNDVIRIESQEKGQDLLVGFEQTKVIALSPTNGKVVWQNDLGVEAGSQQLRLLALVPVGSNAVGILSGIKQPATDGFEARITYVNDKGLQYKKEPIGRLGGGVQLFNTPHELIISAPNRTLLYEKLYK